MDTIKAYLWLALLVLISIAIYPYQVVKALALTLARKQTWEWPKFADWFEMH